MYSLCVSAPLRFEFFLEGIFYRKGAKALRILYERIVQLIVLVVRHLFLNFNSKDAFPCVFAPLRFQFLFEGATSKEFTLPN